MENYSDEINKYFDRLKNVINSIDVNEVNHLMNILMDSLVGERQVFIMGNGGSAATASHFVCDFNKGLAKDTKRFKFICLNDNVPTMMAYANDTSYNDIFVEQLKNFFRAGDIIIGISGSGNSTNVINAIKWGNENEGITVGITGYDGGLLKKMTAHGVHIPVDDMQIVEDLHLVLDHCMMKILYNYL